MTFAPSHDALRAGLVPAAPRLPCFAALASLEGAMLRDHGRELDPTRDGIERTELAATVRPRGAL